MTKNKNLSAGGQKVGAEEVSRKIQTRREEHKKVSQISVDLAFFFMQSIVLDNLKSFLYDDV